MCDWMLFENSTPCAGAVHEYPLDDLEDNLDSIQLVALCDKHAQQTWGVMS